jgi:hypothetical protein
VATQRDHSERIKLGGKEMIVHIYAGNRSQAFAWIDNLMPLTKVYHTFYVIGSYQDVWSQREPLNILLLNSHIHNPGWPRLKERLDELAALHPNFINYINANNL